MYKKDVCVMYYGILVDLQNINFNYAFSNDRHTIYNVTIKYYAITKHDDTKDRK